SRLKYDGALVKVRVDTVVQPDGSRAEREIVEHVGSVAIVAVDDRQRVLLIRQYRHPAGQSLQELPAALRRQPGGPPLGAAQPAQTLPRPGPGRLTRPGRDPHNEELRQPGCAVRSSGSADMSKFVQMLQR